MTANSISDTPASTMPAQTTGLNTSRAAQLAMSSPISQTSLRVPVRPAAAGSSDQATPRSPAVGAAAPPHEQAEHQADHGQQQAERLPGRGVDGSHGTSLRRADRMSGVRDLPDPGFAGDDGDVDPALTAALAAYDRDPDRRHAATLEVLQRHRLLVPVVAVLGEVAYDEQPDGTRLARDKTSDMATVLMRGRDGRTALLAFTSTRRCGAGTPRGDRCRSTCSGPPRPRCRTTRRRCWSTSPDR